MEKEISNEKTIPIQLQIKDHLKERKKRVEDLLNIIFNTFQIAYRDINLQIPLDKEDREFIISLTKEFPELTTGGYSHNYISIPTIIATITKILSDEELHFVISEERNILGVKFVTGLNPGVR